MLSYLNPGKGIYTGITTSGNGGTHPIGQVHYIHGRRSARMSFILPESAAGQGNLGALIDQLVYQSGLWGACNVLAEVDENSPLFETLRRAGFMVYARQQVWQLKAPLEGKTPTSKQWVAPGPTDETAVRSLCQSLIPPLVQSAEAFPESHQQSMIFRQQDELLAYVEGSFGPRGIYLQPVFHPGVDNPSELLAGLAWRLLPQKGRHLYLAVRSYQAGLEPALEELQAGEGPRQVLMVKYLAILQRMPVYNQRKVVLDGHRV
jgi:hypothetical protein